MCRDVSQLVGRPDPLRLEVGLPLGFEGEYYIGVGTRYRDDECGVVDHNAPPGASHTGRWRGGEGLPCEGQPGLWCQWVPSEDGLEISWDGSEKFYMYVEWLEYLVKHFLKPWGYVLSGAVEWVGEERSDQGRILVRDNVIQKQIGHVVYDDED